MSNSQKLKDYSTEIGKKYNELTITGIERKGYHVYAICNCNCGKTGCICDLYKVRTGRTKNCNSIEHNIFIYKNELLGKKYGLLTIKDFVVKKYSDGNRVCSVCDCDCGNKDIIVLLSDLTRQRKKICNRDNHYSNLLKKNKIGLKFGKLGVKDFVLKDNQTYVVCDCDCGNKGLTYKWSWIKNGAYKSCGCGIRREINTHPEIIGKTFGLLHVISFKEERIIASIRQPFFLCQCRCGKYKAVSYQNLVNGHTISCGCLITSGTNLSALKTRIEGTVNTNNVSGINGVNYISKQHKYRAYLNFQRKQIHLGTFDTIGEAYLARKKAEKEYYIPLLEKKYSIVQVKQMINEGRKKEIIPKKVIYSDSHGINTMDIEIAKDLNLIEKGIRNDT